MVVHFRWHDYRYFPYERNLARREIEELGGISPTEGPEGLTVPQVSGWEKWTRRLTYFSEAYSLSGGHVIPDQARLEASSNGGSHSIHVAPKLSRQSTRFSSHGFHEYRGKFHPQIVRSIGNILKLRPESWILDPFCGSGTTLLEALHNGWNAIGLDMNPLAVKIANAKIAVMRVPVDIIKKTVESVSKSLLSRVKGVSFTTSLSKRNQVKIYSEGWKSRFRNIDYLESWFNESILCQVAAILEEVSSLRVPEVRLILQVILSDLLRTYSLQDPDDLRIRRRKTSIKSNAIIHDFIKIVAEKTSRALLARSLLGELSTNQTAILGDAKQIRIGLESSPEIHGRRLFDAAITSPPYATALPYIDTQRLSLVLLDLVHPKMLRKREQSLIGNREITSKDRDVLNDHLNSNAANLPNDIQEFCLTLQKAVNPEKDGFRRKNKPSLIYKYFADMSLMLSEIQPVLRDGGCFALVVGRNFTRLGGKRFVIDTPKFLKVIAELHQFKILDEIELNTYQRFDIHKSNSVKSESLLILEVS